MTYEKYTMTTFLKQENIENYTPTYTNADTLTNKISELEVIVGNENYDIIAVTEIFPKNIDDKKTCSFFIQGYSCIVQEFGRGICLYVKNDYEVNRLDTLESIFSPSIVCEILQKGSEPIICGLFYRSPGSNEIDNDKLNQAIQNISIEKKNSNVLIFRRF